MGRSLQRNIFKFLRDSENSIVSNEIVSNGIVSNGIVSNGIKKKFNMRKLLNIYNLASKEFCVNFFNFEDIINEKFDKKLCWNPMIKHSAKKRDYHFFNFLCENFSRLCPNKRLDFNYLYVNGFINDQQYIKNFSNNIDPFENNYFYTYEQLFIIINICNYDITNIELSKILFNVLHKKENRKNFEKQGIKFILEAKPIFEQNKMVKVYGKHMSLFLPSIIKYAKKINEDYELLLNYAFKIELKNDILQERSIIFKEVIFKNNVEENVNLCCSNFSDNFSSMMLQDYIIIWAENNKEIIENGSDIIGDHYIIDYFINNVEEKYRTESFYSFVINMFDAGLNSFEYCRENFYLQEDIFHKSQNYVDEVERIVKIYRIFVPVIFIIYILGLTVFC